MVGFRLIISMLCIALISAVKSQSASITGLVRDANGALPYVNVAVDAEGKGASTDAHGRFRITGLEPGEHRLRISYLGYSELKRTVRLAPGEQLDMGDLVLEPKASQLEEVVITGTMREVSRSSSPVPVEVITPALFRRDPAPALFDAVGMVNGVRPQINCSVCNTGDIHINGMEGPYTMILIDGMPIVSGLSTVYGLSGIPISLVERVEVVKGPGSALYGSEAMGGIVNVITKDPALAPRASADLMATSWQEYNLDLGIRAGSGKVQGLTGLSMYQYDTPFDKNGDGFTDVTLQKRVSLFQKVSLRRPERRVASIAGRYVHEDRWGGEMDWTPAYAGTDLIYGESIATRRWELIGQYQLPVSERIIAQVSFNRHEQDSWYGITPYNANQQVFFSQLYWSRRFAARHELLAGVAYRYTFYNDNTFATRIGEEPNTRDAPMRQPLPGVFIQDEWSVTDLHTLLLGLRLDNDEHHGLVRSPRLAWKYAPSGRFAVRASFGTGYRVVNLFTEEHAALTGSRTVRITEELEPERSWNTTLNVIRRWPGESSFFSVDASLFHTRFSNRIVPDYDSDPALILYSNLDGYGVSQGVSINVEARPLPALKFLAGATWMEVYNVDHGVEQQQVFAPTWSGTFSTSYDLPKGTTLDLTGQWYGPMRLPTLPNDFRPDHSPWYALLNVQVRHKLGERFEVYGGLKNLLDFVPDDPLMRPFDPFDRTADDPVSNPHGYTFDTTYMYAPLQGRRAYLGLRWTLP